MALTLEQVKSLGFKPTKKKSPFAKSFDTLIYSLNETDYLYIGWDPFSKQMNFKKIWKSFKDSEGIRISYELVLLGDTGFKELKQYIKVNSNG